MLILKDVMNYVFIVTLLKFSFYLRYLSKIFSCICSIIIITTLYYIQKTMLIKLNYLTKMLYIRIFDDLLYKYYLYNNR